MLILLVGLIATGLLLGSGTEFFEDVDEVLAHATLAVAAVRVLSVVLHTVRWRDPITLGMVDGRKRAAPSDAIRSARPLSAVVLCVLLVWWAGGLWRGYDPAVRALTLPFFGATLTIGEREDEAKKDEREHWGRDHEEED